MFSLVFTIIARGITTGWWLKVTTYQNWISELTHVYVSNWGTCKPLAQQDSLFLRMWRLIFIHFVINIYIYIYTFWHRQTVLKTCFLGCHLVIFVIKAGISSSSICMSYFTEHNVTETWIIWWLDIIHNMLKLVISLSCLLSLFSKEKGSINTPTLIEIAVTIPNFMKGLLSLFFLKVYFKGIYVSR